MNALLLHCKSLFAYVEKPELVDAIADEISELRSGSFENDLFLLKLQAKTLLGYWGDFDTSAAYELEPFRKRIEKAKVLVS